MAPVVRELSACSHLEPVVVVTAQHRHLLDQVLDVFKMSPDEDLDVMRENQTLSGLTGRILDGMDAVIARHRPDMVLVHGDTTTTMSTALAAFYNHIPVGHVEAGLRTGNLDSPWPEEANRKLTGVLAAIHFAPTPHARDNLISEGIRPDLVHVTGNTVIDALLDATTRIKNDSSLRQALDKRLPFLDSRKHLILATGHRRENFGHSFEQICLALKAISDRGDTQVVYPVHLNPNVREPVNRILGKQANVHLIEPLDYLPFVYLMSRAKIILTDSGGIQEEAPALGKPVLVLRDTTERPEALAAGTAKLVGTRMNVIQQATSQLLDDIQAYSLMAQAKNPYGDGTAATKIGGLIERYFQSETALSHRIPQLP